MLNIVQHFYLLDNYNANFKMRQMYIFKTNQPIDCQNMNFCSLCKFS